MNKSTELLKVPHSPEAEREILGACLLNGESLGVALDLLTPADFFTTVYRQIFGHMASLHSGGNEVNLWTLADALGADAEIQSAGGIAFLSGLADGLHRLFSISGACASVKFLAARRRLLAAVEDAGEKLQIGIEPVQGIAEQLGMDVESIKQAYLCDRQPATPIMQIVHELLPMISRLREGRTMIGASTGMRGLDSIVPGWVPGEFVVLAARPSCGKSALAGELALRQAKSGNSVAIFSLEMSRLLFVLRLACREGSVNLVRLLRGTLSGSDWGKSMSALATVAELPIWIDDTAALDVRQLQSRAKVLAQQQKIRLVIVDYLQLLHVEGENRFEKVTAISQALKATAREIGDISAGTILALSQLNRIAAEEEPDLHHLRESGQLEQDADAVLLLFDDKQPSLSGSKYPRKVLKVAKQRNGPLGRLPLVFLDEFTGFEEAVPEGWES